MSKGNQDQSAHCNSVVRGLALYDTPPNRHRIFQLEAHRLVPLASRSRTGSTYEWTGGGHGTISTNAGEKMRYVN